MKMWLVLWVIVGICFGRARSSLPSPSEANVRFYLTKKGADYANVIMVNNTKSTLEGRKVPPVKITKSIWWKTIRLSLSKSKIKSVLMGSTSIQFTNGFIKLSLGINSAEVAGVYDYEGGFMFGSGKGRYSVKLKNVWITKYLSIGTNAKGKPVLVNGACSNWIENVSPEFSGGSSFIINLLVALAKSSVDKDVRKKICTSITEAVDKKGKMMPGLYPESYNISRIQCAQVNFPILQQPLIKTDYIEFLMEGGIDSSCYQLSRSSDEQGVNNVTHVPKLSKMISIVFSDRYINSLAELYYQAGIMKLADVQSKELLSPLRVAMHLTRPPIFNTTFNSSVAVFNVQANLTTNSSIDEKTQHIVVDLEIKADFDMEEEDREISGKVKNFRIRPSFTQDIPEKIKSLVLPVIKSCSNEIINQMNGFLHKMAPLPMVSYIHLTNKQFLRHEGYTVLESDVKM